MSLILSVICGLLYSWNQSSTISSFTKNPEFKDSYGGFLSAMMYSASILSLILCRLPYKYSAIITSVLMAISNLSPNLIIQRFFIGISSPHIFNFMSYSNLSYNQQIAYASYYNIACLLGTSLGIISDMNIYGFIALWAVFLIFIVLSSDAKRTEEVYLQQIISLEVIYFISFISELLGEAVTLTAPMVLESVWEWPRWKIEYLMFFANIIGIPVQLILTKKLYISSRQLIISSIGICGVSSSMLTSLFYSFIWQYLAGICTSLVAVYFTRAAICYFVCRAYGAMAYAKVALAGIIARIFAGFAISIIDREDHEELNRNLFLPITFVIVLSLFAVNRNKDMHDGIKRN